MKSIHWLHSILFFWLRLVCIFVLLGMVGVLSPRTPIHAQEEVPVEPEAIGLETVILSREREGNRILTEVEIPISQDSFVASNQPDTNFNSSINGRVGYNATGNNYGAVRSFIQFNLSSIPANSTINSARIRFYMYEATPAGDSPMLVRVRHLNSSWDANTITWNSHEPDWGNVVIEQNVDTVIGWKEADATAFVRDWYYGVRPNYGLFLQGDEGSGERQRIAYSIQANNALYPRLVVNYGTSVDNIPPTATVNPLPQWSASTFTVTWGGSDNPGGSGIDYYEVQFNANGGSWIPWRTNTEETTGQFTGGQDGITYQFRARAVDNEGNVQEWGNVQTQTRVDGLAPNATINPLPQWSGSAFTVSWSGNDSGSGIEDYDVQYSVNGGSFIAWINDTTATSAQFTGGQNGASYQFRVRAEDKVGNEQVYGGAQAQTAVDAQPPSVSVNPLPAVQPSPNFYVSWGGTDNASGIARYDVQYRIRGQAWQMWQSGTTATSALFVGPEVAIYDFRARGTDNVGNVQAYQELPQATTQVVTHPTATMNPIIPPIVTGTTTSIVISWQGNTAPGTTITAYDIRYRFNNGAWTHFLTTHNTSAEFTFITGPDGTYEFEARATNNLGQVEPYTGIVEARVFVDRLPPFIEPQSYMPLMMREAGAD